MEFSPGFKRMFTVAVCVTVIVLVANSAESASVHKRSIVRRNISNNSSDECRTNAVCGWEIYNTVTRAHQYYISSSCKCVAKETCIRVEDDISIPAYVYRCREVRRKKTTSRPSTDAINTTTESS